MNINEMTLGQIKEVAAVASNLGVCSKQEQSITVIADEKPVLVTTEHRGVFFGYLSARSESNGKVTVKMRNCRNVVYWSSDAKGFLGLASDGPTKSCKIGPAANVELMNVTSVSEVTPTAVKAFEAAPWAK
jgi:hypothetical protein